ncbi:hypothetical protein V1277_000803 [Bradyrhizobium sp. AZCC 1588]|uniref:hypothetical protein n=1 Tax=unclassified Bradyrhizobium TaxID=2631580 RepID=UPI002FF43D4D
MASLPFELTGKAVYVAGHRGMVGGIVANNTRAEQSTDRLSELHISDSPHTCTALQG